MQVSAITIAYRKQVSDGNNGTEAAEATLAVTFDGDEPDDVNRIMAMLFTDARHAVFARLDESPSAAVRRSLRA